MMYCTKSTLLDLSRRSLPLAQLSPHCQPGLALAEVKIVFIPRMPFFRRTQTTPPQKQLKNTQTAERRTLIATAPFDSVAPRPLHTFPSSLTTERPRSPAQTLGRQRWHRRPPPTARAAAQRSPPRIWERSRSNTRAGHRPRSHPTRRLRRRRQRPTRPLSAMSALTRRVIPS